MGDDAPELSGHEDFNPPEGYRCEWVDTRTGRMRCAVWEATGPQAGRGTVVISHGLSEHIEKYSEVVEKLLSRGLAVAMMDWPGHGRSAPCPKARKEDFKAYDEAFADFMEQKVIADLPEPRVIIGHSMGGCLALCACHDRPDWFAGCVLSSPLIGAKAVKQATLLPHLSKGMALLPDKLRSKINEKKRFDGQFTADKARFERNQALLKAHKDLTPSYDFVFWFSSMNKRLESMKSSGWLSAIKTPTLFLLAGSDSLVDNDAAISAATQIEGAEFTMLDNAWHELLMERETVQLPLWESIDEFLAKHAPMELASSGTSEEPSDQAQPGEPADPDQPFIPPTPDKLVM